MMSNELPFTPWTTHPNAVVIPASWGVGGIEMLEEHDPDLFYSFDLPLLLPLRREEVSNRFGSESEMGLWPAVLLHSGFEADLFCAGSDWNLIAKFLDFAELNAPRSTLGRLVANFKTALSAGRKGQFLCTDSEPDLLVLCRPATFEPWARDNLQVARSCASSSSCSIAAEDAPETEMTPLLLAQMVADKFFRHLYIGGEPQPIPPLKEIIDWISEVSPETTPTFAEAIYKVARHPSTPLGRRSRKKK